MTTEPNWALVGVIASHARAVRMAEGVALAAEKARVDFVTANADVVTQLRKLEADERAARSRFDLVRTNALEAIGWELPKEPTP